MSAPVGSAAPGTRAGVDASPSLHRPPALDALLGVARPERVGVVTSAVGLSLEVAGLSCGIGDLVHVGDGPHRLDAEVVATAEGRARCMPLGRLSGVRAGDPVRTRGTGVLVPTGRGLFGRVVDALGRPVDGRGPLARGPRVPVDADAPAAMERARIDTPLQTGVRVLDTLTTLGRGQRIGLFAGSGVGKSSLLSMVARGTDAEVSVIALVGERGREVREFLEDDLGPEGLARSVVVVATSDEPAMMRKRAAFTATRIAESFREAGSHVVLMMDSLTRVSMAQREIGLSVGSPRDARLPAVDVLPHGEPARAGGHRGDGLRHRDLHRPGRRRRPQRADRRPGALDPRRARGARPVHRRVGPLPGGRRARVGLARRVARDDARAEVRRPDAAPRPRGAP